MKVFARIADLRAWLAPHRRAGTRIGLVPTMGYLHEGHLALVRRARRECGVVVVSIFVNPLQFGPGEDYERYPRNLARDCRLLVPEGVDAVFAPPREEMYPLPPLAYVDVAELGQVLCGRSRPGHFRGVATVVAKLFHIVQPDVAYFGEKDYQQLLVVRRMVADLDFPVEVVGVPTVREPDGLAMSSRNAYLSPEERRAAAVLYRALALARARVQEGERDAAALRRSVADCIAAEPLARLDYAEVVDAETLKPLQRLSGRVLVAVAAWFGKARLIDNVVLEVSEAGAGSDGVPDGSVNP